MDKKQQEQSLFLTPSKDKWRSLGTKRRAGVLAPLFLVYSKNSVGIGDFSDLKLLIDFCKKTGNSILQLLPMNEVGAGLCPYDAVSSFAIEPMYLSLKDAVNSRIDNLKKQFPLEKNCINYQIKDAKINLLWEFFLNDGEAKEKDLEKFVSENDYWIGDFSLYKVLKKYHGMRAWYDWPDEFKNRDKKSLDTFRRSHAKEINFEIWLQFLCFRQFKEAKIYANKNKVLLKGDLPILVSKDSADVWARKDFFNLSFASGAPPDMYCAKGQRWGMPTYKWENISQDNYTYLKNKLRFAENFYDILRIDHVVGLFRIWSIPYDDPLENQGLNGFFNPPEESLWEEHGRKILKVIVNSTKMLVCAEDLGVIPASCPKVIKELGIPGNDVGRWVKDWVSRHDFLRPEEYRFLSVSMLSTHDTTNFCAWWEFEAGTVDEALFKRKCLEREVNFDRIKNKLFDFSRSRHGRLRWRDEINSVDLLLWNLATPRDQALDFIDIYENTFGEKEKLSKLLKISGTVREKCGAEIVEKMFKFILQSNAIFSIQLLIDWLYLADIFDGEAYKYRVNAPGTVNQNNWSLVLPLSLNELLGHKVCKKIKGLIKQSGRN